MADNSKPLSAPDVILFDFDGVLYQYSFLALKAQIFMNKLRFLIRKNKKPRKNSENKSGKKAAPKKSLSYAFGRALMRPRPLAGVEKFLQYLEEKGIGSGIASNASPLWANPLLEKFGLSKYFAAFAFRNGEMQLKPAPDSLISAMAQLKAAGKKEPKTVWYIGDMATDIEAAINAGNSNGGYEVIPVALGRKTGAAKKLLKLQEAGLALNGLVFKDFEEMLRGLQQVVSSTPKQSPQAPK